MKFSVLYIIDQGFIFLVFCHAFGSPLTNRQIDFNNLKFVVEEDFFVTLLIFELINFINYIIDDLHFKEIHNTVFVDDTVIKKLDIIFVK